MAISVGSERLTCQKLLPMNNIGMLPAMQPDKSSETTRRSKAFTGNPLISSRANIGLSKYSRSRFDSKASGILFKASRNLIFVSKLVSLGEITLNEGPLPCQPSISNCVRRLRKIALAQ